MAIKVTLSEICDVLDQLIDGKLTRNDVLNWAVDRWFPEDESQLIVEPVERAEEIREAIAWMLYLDHTYPANRDEVPQDAEFVSPERIIASSSGKELEIYHYRLEDIKEFRQSLDTPGSLWKLVE